MTKYQSIFNFMKHFGDYDIVGEDISYKVIIDDEAKEVILQFEETDSRQDWKHNLMFLPWLLKLENKYIWTSHGYACAYKSTSSIPLDCFYEAVKAHPTYRRVIRGWSFGSAMTKIAVRHYIIKYGKEYPINEELTYGDVKCFLNPFWKYRVKKYVGKVHNFVTSNDLVTWCVPFYVRTNKCKVSNKLRIKELFKTVWYHTHYEEYDYSKYE